jgi:hypothetical protein
MALWKMAHIARLFFTMVGSLGLMAHHGDATVTRHPASAADAELSARIDRAREQLIDELGAKDASAGHAGRIAQWFNWGNWPNWYNGWRNW